MELSQKILDFWDEMCDGHGLAKMIFQGRRRDIPEEKIKLAAKEIYYRHMAGNRVKPIDGAKAVYRLAKDEMIRSLHIREYEAALDRDQLLLRIEALERKIKPFRTKLFEWWPNEIYFM